MRSCWLASGLGISVTRRHSWNLKNSYVKDREHNIPTSHYVKGIEPDVEKIRCPTYPLIINSVGDYSSRGVRRIVNPEERAVCFAEVARMSSTVELGTIFLLGEHIACVHLIFF